jgi:uroporphyrinogen-III synthase
VDAVALTSSEAVDWLFMLGGESRRATLQSLLYVAPHPRIAQRLAECGASRCLITAADNDALVAALCEWFETRP